MCLHQPRVTEGAVLTPGSTGWRLLGAEFIPKESWDVDDRATDDVDPTETQEWLDSFTAVVQHEGVHRAQFLLERLAEKAHDFGARPQHRLTSPYLNTISRERQKPIPGDQAVERQIRSLVRWNALAMVLRANREHSGIGGHIASFASIATLFDVGFNHFFRAPSAEHDGDLVFFQGHSAPGIYARAFLEGRIDEAQLLRFRQEVNGGGLSSYPHPWLMPGFWQFPTVSMGLTPPMAVAQARLMRYMELRGIRRTQGRKVWAFLGDGEMDEPESLAPLALASREHLDNLIFVVNCNLQRLDGPVRGNGKIIQELEALFRGAGWNVIKVIWGSYWDPLLSRDTKGLLRRRMEEVIDGEYQAYKARGGAYTREHFFGKYPELQAMVADMTDEDIWRLNRGGHDPHKIYAAYAAAVEHTGQPTVILAKTVKGYGMGEAGEGQNITHQQKKMSDEALKSFRVRFNIPIDEAQAITAPFYKPPDDSNVVRYMKERRADLGGYLPTRVVQATPLTIPPLEAFDLLLKDSGERELSTTMAFGRILATLLRDPAIGKVVVPIIPDEARTFGLEGMFRQFGIYSPLGQRYDPVDVDQISYYKESEQGQILEEGINEAGALCSWLAAATAYANHRQFMVPFFIFYSMFGFQRVGDFIWAAGDSRARGFLLGATAGRTTLQGEGLQHQDGHSHLAAATIPNCVPYDPTFAYELAVIMHDGLRRMYSANEDVFYYITVMNENYAHPALPEDTAEGILKGMYLLQAASETNGLRVQLMGSGTILREVIKAAAQLKNDFGVAADVWSATSFTLLRRDGLDVERWNMLHPDQAPRRSYVERCLADHPGPVIAATDYVKTFADQIRPFIGRTFKVLGTDGFGRSDTREQLRDFFEVNSHYVTVAALSALAQDGQISTQRVTEAIEKYGLDPAKPNPVAV